MEDLNKKLNDLGDKIDAKIEHVAEKSEQFGKEYAKQVKEELDKKFENYLDQVAAIEKRIDESEMAGKKLNHAEHGHDQAQSFQKGLKVAMQDETKMRGLNSFANGETSKFKMDVKAILATGVNASGDVLPSDRMNQIFYDPTRKLRVRDLLSTGTTDSARIRYIQENSYTNNAAMRQEASAFGESEFVHYSVDADVESLGTIMRLTKEMLADHKLLNSYLSARVPAKVLDVEDTQLLTGNGSAPNIQGLMASGGATAFDEASTGAFFDFFSAADQSGLVGEYDVLVAAINQIELQNYSPTAILLNPTDYHKIWLKKATDGQYTAYKDTAPLTIGGVPVFKSTAQTAGQFIVGDFSMGSQVFFREGMSLEFSEEDSTNFQRNLVTLKASERLTQAIWLPNAFAYGTFSSAITSLR